MKKILTIICAVLLILLFISLIVLSTVEIGKIKEYFEFSFNGFQNDAYLIGLISQLISHILLSMLCVVGVISCVFSFIRSYTKQKLNELEKGE